MVVQQFLTLSEAAKRTGLSETELHKRVQAGKIPAAQIKGELALREDIIQEVTPKEMLPEYKKYKELEGVEISISDASRKYDIPTSTITRWMQHAYIKQLRKEKRRTLLDERDVAYCAEFHNEWERMLRLHEKNKTETEHTQNVLCFCYQARQRGYQAGVMPQINSGKRFAPDAVVVDPNGEQLYVEVELSHHVKAAKWCNMAKAQGKVAICAPNPVYQERLVEHAREAVGESVPILATDLQTLFSYTNKAQHGPLWVKRVRRL
jgi:hypothetical protein